MEFFRNAEINLQPVYRPPPLNKNRGGEGGVCTQAINLRLHKGIALLTLPVNNNLHTCNLHCLLYSRLTQISTEACRLRLNINYQYIHTQ